MGCNGVLFAARLAKKWFFPELDDNETGKQKGLTSGRTPDSSGLLWICEQLAPKLLSSYSLSRGS